jgi:NAD(P)-dependent dehydrogenase (short-subunit alcohol dehydrogenase family)
MFDLTGKRALVTGASRGAGFGIAKTLAAANASVVATARNEQGLKKLRAEIEAAGGRCEIQAGDLSTRVSAREVAARCGEVDILINNAALTSAKYQSMLVKDDAYWDLEFALNVIAPVTLMQEFIPGMLKRGRGVVINISSISAQKPNALHAPYGASKAALEVASRAAALEFSPSGVRVVVVAFGMTDTEALAEAVAGNMTVAEMGRMFAPIGRATKVEEVAALCLYLSSDEAAALTGSVITIDGGVTAGMYDFGRGFGTGLTSELKRA